MRVNHSRLRREILINRVNEHHLPRRLLLSILLALAAPAAGEHVCYHAAEHGQRRVEDADVFAEYVRRGERVEGDWAGETGLIAHQGAQEILSAMVQ